MNFYNDIDCYSDRIAIITEKCEKITYKTLLQDADDMMLSLETRSIIFLICNNSLESLCAYIGTLRKKVVPIMINEKIEDTLFKKLYETYRPSYIYMPVNWKDLSDIDLLEISSYRNFKMYRTGYKQDYKLNEDLALLLTTSGSTGSPKLVRQSYQNITSNANSISTYLKINANDRAITTMPMSYTYCLSIINSHLLKGACLIMNDYSVIQREFWSLFKKTEPTTFGGVPFIYEQLKALRFERMNIPSLRYITQAGGKLSTEMTEIYNTLCEKKKIEFIIMYGQTEATARMSYLPWKMAKEKVGSIGIAIPGGTFSLIDGQGNEITEPNSVGELVYQGDNVTLGYAQNCYDLSKADENQGILYTGDMAKRDEDGFYYIVGRKKRFLKMYGNRVNLDEVEALLTKQGYIGACGGIDDQLKIYTTERNQEKHTQIKEYLSQALGFTMKSFEVIYIEEIPRNEAGKILYSALEQREG